MLKFSQEHSLLTLWELRLRIILQVIIYDVVLHSVGIALGLLVIHNSCMLLIYMYVYIYICSVHGSFDQLYVLLSLLLESFIKIFDNVFW